MRRTFQMWAGCLATVALAGAIRAAPEERSASIPATVYAHYAADSATNQTAALNQPFSPAEIDVARGVLKLDNLKFLPIPYPVGIGPAAAVYFSSSGKLPTPLQAETPYFLAPAKEGGYRVFPYAMDQDADKQPGAILGEKVFYAQNLVQGVAAVAFRDAGSGRHLLATRPLLSQLTDLTKNGFNALATKPGDRHSHLELRKDGQGRSFVWTGGSNSRENHVGSYNNYGQMLVQGPSGRRLPAREFVAGKSAVYQIFVARVRSFWERQVVKFVIGPDQVSTQTDKLTYAADARMQNKVETGDLIICRAYAEGHLPKPLLPEKDYFLHRVSKTELTLHASLEAAMAGTDPIDLTSEGQGNLAFYLPQRVGDARRWSFFAEVLEPGPGGGNALSARLQEPIPQGNGILRTARAFSLTGQTAGQVSGLSSVPDLTPISFWVPPRAALPSPLRPGQVYWVSRAGNSVRLHESLAAAQKGSGQPTASSGCILFTAPGKGETLASFADGASAISYGTLEGLVRFPDRVPLEQLCVLAFRVQYENGTEPAYATLGINQGITSRQVLRRASAPTPPAANDKSHAWSLFNSAQGHVPIDMDVYEIFLGSADMGNPEADIEALVEHCLHKYRIGAR